MEKLKWREGDQILDPWCSVWSSGGLQVLCKLQNFLISLATYRTMPVPLYVRGQMFWNEPGWVNSVSLVTRVFDGMPQGSNSGMDKRCFVQSVMTGSGNYPTTYPLGTLVLSQGYGCRGMKLTTYGYPVLRLRLRGSIPLLASVRSWKAEGQLCFLLIFWMKSRRIRWAEHVTHMGEGKRYADRVLVGKHEGKRLHGRPRLG